MFGGSIDVKSEVGKGSTFSFTVRLKVPQNLLGYLFILVSWRRCAYFLSSMVAVEPLGVYAKTLVVSHSATLRMTVSHQLHSLEATADGAPAVSSQIMRIWRL